MLWRHFYWTNISYKASLDNDDSDQDLGLPSNGKSNWVKKKTPRKNHLPEIQANFIMEKSIAFSFKWRELVN